MGHDKERKYKPFAITATALGHPGKLYTPITVVNISDGGELVAATVNAMWDTGADVCLISRRLAEALLIDFTKTIPAEGVMDRDKVAIGITRVALLSNGETIDTYSACFWDFCLGINQPAINFVQIYLALSKTCSKFAVPTNNSVYHCRRATVKGSTFYRAFFMPLHKQLTAVISI